MEVTAQGATVQCPCCLWDGLSAVCLCTTLVVDSWDTMTEHPLCQLNTGVCMTSTDNNLLLSAAAWTR